MKKNNINLRPMRAMAQEIFWKVRKWRLLSETDARCVKSA